MWFWLINRFKNKKTSPLANPFLEQEKSAAINLASSNAIQQNSWFLDLPIEVISIVFEYLPMASALMVIMACQQSKFELLGEYYRRILREKFTDQLPKDEVITRFSDSRLKFESNQERFIFLVKNLLEARSEVDWERQSDNSRYKFSSGCYAGQSVFKIIFIDLNCWKLFSLKQIERLEERAQDELVLFLPKIKSLAGFKFVVQNIFNSTTALKDKVIKSFTLLKQEFNKEQLQIFFEEAAAKNMQKQLHLTPLEEAVISSTKDELGLLLEKPGVVDAEIRIENSLAPPKFEARSLVLAMQTGQDEKLKLLLTSFKDHITETVAKELLILAYKMDHLKAAQLLLDNFPSLAQNLVIMDSVIVGLLPKENKLSANDFEPLIPKREAKPRKSLWKLFSKTEETLDVEPIKAAIKSGDQNKLTALLNSHCSEITIEIAKELIMFASQENNMLAIQAIIAQLQPQIRNSISIDNVIQWILVGENKDEVFKLFLKGYLEAKNSEEQKKFLIRYFLNPPLSNKNYRWAKLLQFLINKVDDDAKKVIPNLIIDILNETDRHFWINKLSLDKAQINGVNKGGVPPLYIAVMVGNVNAINYLLHNGVVLNDVKILLVAIKNLYPNPTTNLEILNILMGTQLISKVTDELLVSSAVETQNIGILKAVYNDLTKKYLSKNHVDIAKAFAQAVKFNNIEMVDYLLQMCPEIKVNITEILQGVVTSGQAFDAAILVRLLAHPLSTQGPNDLLGWDADALYYAIKMGRQDLVALLFEKGCNINRFYKLTEQTPLTLALSNGQFNIVEFLLRQGADPCPRGFTHPRTGLYSSLRRRNFPLYWLITHYTHGGILPSQQTHKLLTLMLNKIQHSPKPYYSGLLNSYRPNEKRDTSIFGEGIRWTMGVELMITAVQRKLPPNLIESMVDSLSFDLNAPGLNSSNIDKGTLFTHLIEELERGRDQEYLKKVISILIKKGLDCFVPRKNHLWNFNGIAQLARYGISIAELGFERVTSEIMNDLVQQHWTLIKQMTSYPSQYIQGSKESVVNNLQMILANEKFHASLIKFSVANWSSKCRIASYFELLCYAFGGNCSLLFKNALNNDSSKALLVRKLCSYTDPSGQNFLHYGAKTANGEFLNHLLGANILPINQTDNDRNTALHYALESQDNKDKVVDALLRQPGIRLDIKNKKEKTAWDLISRNFDFVAAVMENSQFNDQLDHLDSTASYRISCMLLKKQDAKDLFAKVRSHIDPYKILGLYLQESQSGQSEARVLILKLIKYHSESEQGESFLPNRKTLRFIKECLSKEVSVNISVEKELAELAKELSMKYPEKNWSSDFFNEASNEVLHEKGRIVGEDFVKNNFLRIQR
jgi:ankyrin repeat protein